MDTTVKWPSGLFGWGQATRTFYALEPKSVSVSHQSGFASQTSHHGVAEEDPSLGQSHVDTPRLSAQLVEFCVMFHQSGDDALTLATWAFTLTAEHAQYDYHTTLPFPLHELVRSGGSVTFDAIT